MILSIIKRHWRWPALHARRRAPGALSGSEFANLTGICKMTKILNDAQRRIEALRFTGSGAGCLDSFIRCANSNDTPLDLATLRMAREIEQHSPGCRLTMIRLLDREIRRQEKAQAKARAA